ncbi:MULTISPECIES: hypothetical protein [Thermocrispum]|jgi:hypothetical protein|uniref:Uncharacterized protein n=1 Tax=Thermocrispum agreste TaxID=37925 RepID=A0ABD6FBZ2_9PSEU|nr:MULTISPECIES: hypothetical protein [Thermocrispum]
MVTDDDRRELALAAELLTHVIERHRAEDLRVLSALCAALQEIRTGERYLTESRPAAR